MKGFVNLIILSLLVLSLGACTPSSKKKNSGSTDTDTGVDNNGTPDNGGGNGGGTHTYNTCSGTSSDGMGDGYAIHSLNLFLAGHQAWLPGTYSDPLAQQTMPTIKQAGLLFKSDTKLKIRFKVNAQPFPTAGEEYCYGRDTEQPADQYPYTKLRFRVHLRDVICLDNPAPANPDNCQSYGLGDRYRTQIVEPISEGTCGPIIDLGPIRNQTVYGTTIEVEDVKADSACQAGAEYYCPAEKIVRAASCWSMTLQVVTDYTQDFAN